MFETVSVIGGDLRQLTLAGLLKSEGYHVFLYGFDKDIQLDDIDLEEDKDFVMNSDIIILPVPVTFDGVTINSPYAKSPLTVDELLYDINPSALVFGGQIQPNLKKAFEDNHIAYRDYLKREELSIKNAVPIVLAVWLRIFRIKNEETHCIPSYILQTYNFTFLYHGCIILLISVS